MSLRWRWLSTRTARLPRPHRPSPKQWQAPRSHPSCPVPHDFPEPPVAPECPPPLFRLPPLRQIPVSRQKWMTSRTAALDATFGWAAQQLCRGIFPKLPKDLVEAVCQRLLLLLGDPGVSAEQRRLLVALTLSLPRRLWPEPPKTPGTQLHPRPRPPQERARVPPHNEPLAPI